MMLADDEAVIGEWLSRGGAFVCYREPGARVCRGLRAAPDALRPFEDISLLDGKSGFVFAPFRVGREHPLWLLPGGDGISVALSRASCSGEVEAPAPVPFVGERQAQSTEAYSRAFRAFSDALRGGRFRKLVLSREQVGPSPVDFSWAKAFCAACRRYVHSYVYLFYAPQTGYWLGATPEILLETEGAEGRTMALAGTQFLRDGVLREPWSEKNIREQAYVTDYIMDCLRGQGLSPAADGPQTATAGELAHLRTDIRFALPSTGMLGSLLRALHPTPAVCGLPKDEAFRFIGAHEGYDRSYYAGFLGRLSPGGHTALYVNLRCMACSGEAGTFRLYAGGGLLPESVLEEEWTETERKLQTMKYVIEKGKSHVYR